MTRLWLRYRRTLILSAALILSFVLMTLQVRSQSARADLAKHVLLTSISPFLRAAAVSRAAALGLWNEYIDLRRVRQDNQLFKEEIRQLRLQVSALRETALENGRLGQLLEMKRRLDAEAVAARVIGKDSTNWFKTILIDKGANGGVQRHMVVVTAEGVVGRVTEVAALSSRVQLVTDPESAVGVLIQRSRVTGVAAGSQEGTVQIRYLPLMADVAVGDRVITSGMGGIFPKGVPLGRVVKSSRPTNGALFQETEVQPLTDFSRLEEVMILTRPTTSDLVWGGSERRP